MILKNNKVSKIVRKYVNRVISKPQKMAIQESLNTVQVLMLEIPNPLLFAEAQQREKLQDSRNQTFLVMKYKIHKKMEIIKSQIELKENLINANEINEEFLEDSKKRIKLMLQSARDDLEIMKEMQNCITKDEDPFLFLDEEKMNLSNMMKRKRADDIGKVSEMIRTLDNKNSKKWTVYKHNNKIDLEVVDNEAQLDESQLLLDISDSKQLLDKLREKENEGLERLLKQTKTLQQIISDLTEGLKEGIKEEIEIEKIVDANIVVVQKQEIVMERAKKTVNTKMKLIAAIVLLIVVLFVGFFLLGVSIAVLQLL